MLAKLILPFFFTIMYLPVVFSAEPEPPLSPKSQECIACHSLATPAMVADWKKSRHAMITVGEAIKVPDLKRKVSSDKIPEEYLGYAVGCAECHTMNPESHKDVFDHGEQQVHPTVTPKDCATCHSKEVSQYDKNLMSHARKNMINNTLYMNLVNTVNGTVHFNGKNTTITPPNEKTQADSCFHCHGTSIEVKGKTKRDTDYGEMEFPVLAGWPNQGVGRYNPDGSMGTCFSCHSRHQFSITVARKPYTCSQCHKGPDVPAYKAYEVSKHANIFSSLHSDWDFKAVPWTVGKDFTAPTCATCHASLLVNGNGDVVAERTHQMNDRLPWRILGLIYAHPHTKSPDTSIVRNKDGLPLPTALSGEVASEFLIDKSEMDKRQQNMLGVCRSCHSSDWVAGQWDRFENTIGTTNEMTKTATDILIKAWADGLADQKGGLFDETLEKSWVEQWLFYANSTRFASAMMGADYGVFANGRWYLTKNIQEMLDRVKFLGAAKSNEKVKGK